MRSQCRDVARLADTAVLSVLGYVNRRGMGTGSRPNDQEKPQLTTEPGAEHAAADRRSDIAQAAMRAPIAFRR
jgi:hypothetical protein